MLDEFTQILNPKAMGAKLAAYLPDVLAAVLLLAVFWIVAAMVRRGLSAVLRRSGVSEGPRKTVVKLARFGMLAIGLLTIADPAGRERHVHGGGPGRGRPGPVVRGPGHGGQPHFGHRPGHRPAIQGG